MWGIFLIYAALDMYQSGLFSALKTVAPKAIYSIDELQALCPRSTKRMKVSAKSAQETQIPQMHVVLTDVPTGQYFGDRDIKECLDQIEQIVMNSGPQWDSANVAMRVILLFKLRLCLRGSSSQKQKITIESLYFLSADLENLTTDSRTLLPMLDLIIDILFNNETSDICDLRDPLFHLLRRISMCDLQRSDIVLERLTSILVLLIVKMAKPARTELRLFVQSICQPACNVTFSTSAGQILSVI